MIKAIILDFDGVILESVNIKTDAFCEIFKDYPQHLERIKEYHLHHGGISRVEKFKYIYRNFLNESLDEEKLNCLCQRFRDLVVEKVVGCPFVPGAEKFLNTCYGQYQMFVVSGTPQDEVRQIVGRRNLEKYFVETFGSPSTKAQIIEHILTHYQWSPKEVVFIGDSIDDFEAAKGHSIDFIARVNDESTPLRGQKGIREYFADMQGVGDFIQSLNDQKVSIKRN